MIRTSRHAAFEAVEVDGKGLKIPAIVPQPALQAGLTGLAPAWEPTEVLRGWLGLSESGSWPSVETDCAWNTGRVCLGPVRVPA